MRRFQLILFFLAAATLIAALIFMGTGTGDVLWRIGIAALLGDIVCIMLWPSSSSDRELSNDT